MKRQVRRCLVLAGLALAVSGSVWAAGSANLGGLEGLVGKWQAKFPDGKVAVANYELASGGSALVEHLEMGGEPSMVTIYHRDGGDLMLTHYCSLQNQPRMRATSGNGKVFDFAFVDATNLASPTAPHMHSLKLTLAGADHFVQDWTFDQGGKQEVRSFRFERVK